MPEYPFPDSIPLEQIREAKDAILGKPGARLYNPAWVVAGYALEQVEPNGSNVRPPSYGASYGTRDLTDDELVSLLDALEVQAESGRPVVQGIGSSVVRAIAKKLLKLAYEAL